MRRIKLSFHTKGENITNAGAFMLEKIIIFTGTNNNYSKIKQIKIKRTTQWINDNQIYSNSWSYKLKDDDKMCHILFFDTDVGYPQTKDSEYTSSLEFIIEDIYQGQKSNNIIINEILFLGTLLEPHNEG